jgi:hypothetical protein
MRHRMTRFLDLTLPVLVVLVGLGYKWGAHG